MFTRIVVGADGSPEGQDAVVLGAAIAAATGAGLTLLQSFSPSLIPSPGYTDRHTLTRSAQVQLSADRRRFAPNALTEVLPDSHPARALRRYADRWHADLVVIGSNRHAPAGRCAIGPTGRELLEKAPFALAIARRGLHEHGLVLSNVAVGYDHGPESEIALSFADEIAAACGAELLLERFVRESVPPPLSEALDQTREAAGATAAHSRADTQVGEPGERLRQLSEGVDLMVIGSRRWGALARVVLGGVGEALVGDCGTSLLVTRRPLRHPSAVPVPATHPEEAGDEHP